MFKILVVRYRFIGDTVLTVPFLRNLRRAYPDAQIDMLVGPVSGEVLADCPYIDNLIVFDTTRKHKYDSGENHKKSFFSYVKSLKKTGYDKAYVLKRSFSSTFLVFLAGIKERIGFDTEHRGFLLTKKVPYVMDRHEIECFLDVLRVDGVAVQDNYLENWINPKSNAKINNLLMEYNASNTSKVLIHATSGNKNKQWPLVNFAEVIEYLANRGMQIFYTGTEEDSKVYEEIHNLADHELPVEPINLCGKLSIQDSTALIKRMDFVIGSDSGTLHIAASLNIPVIGIYGPMNPTKWQAWGNNNSVLYSDIPCVPCELRKECRLNNECLWKITPEMVLTEADKRISALNRINC